MSMSASRQANQRKGRLRSIPPPGNTHFGKALAGKEGHAGLLHQSDREGVLLEVARGEALVGRVEEDVVALADDDLDELLPLIGRRVDAGRLR